MDENTNRLTNAIRDAMFDLRAELIKQDKFKSADIPALARNIMPHIVKMATASDGPVEFLKGGIVKEISNVSAGLMRSFYDDNNESARPGYVRWPIGHVIDIIHKILPELVAGMAEKGKSPPLCLHCRLVREKIGAERNATETPAPDDQAKPEPHASEGEKIVMDVIKAVTVRKAGLIPGRAETPAPDDTVGHNEPTESKG